ncbi:MAG: GNAT family N-acetyltransferase [Clostridia bacterium]
MNFRHYGGIYQYSEGLKKTILYEGAVFAAFDKDILVGFASLEHNYFGSENQYIQLSMIHITRNYRNLGIGKVLFELCINKAKEFGAEKLYISASSCENGQSFYKKMGCVPADEINQKLFELEPYDCHMEFVL